jgi:hypothetical protein
MVYFASKEILMKTIITLAALLMASPAFAQYDISDVMDGASKREFKNADQLRKAMERAATEDSRSTKGSSRGSANNGTPATPNAGPVDAEGDNPTFTVEAGKSIQITSTKKKQVITVSSPAAPAKYSKVTVKPGETKIEKLDGLTVEVTGENPAPTKKTIYVSKGSVATKQDAGYGVTVDVVVLTGDNKDETVKMIAGLDELVLAKRLIARRIGEVGNCYATLVGNDGINQEYAAIEIKVDNVQPNAEGKVELVRATDGSVLPGNSLGTYLVRTGHLKNGNITVDDKNYLKEDLAKAIRNGVCH